MVDCSNDIVDRCRLDVDNVDDVDSMRSVRIWFTLVPKVSRNSSNRRIKISIYIAASSRSKLPGLVSKYLHFFSDLD